jgi:hypothetical protein
MALLCYLYFYIADAAAFWKKHLRRTKTANLQVVIMEDVLIFFLEVAPIVLLLPGNDVINKNISPPVLTSFGVKEFL